MGIRSVGWGPSRDRCDDPQIKRPSRRGHTMHSSLVESASRITPCTRVSSKVHPESRPARRPLPATATYLESVVLVQHHPGVNQVVDVWGDGNASVAHDGVVPQVIIPEICDSSAETQSRTHHTHRKTVASHAVASCVVFADVDCWTSRRSGGGTRHCCPRTVRHDHDDVGLAAAAGVGGAQCGGCYNDGDEAVGHRWLLAGAPHEFKNCSCARTTC